MKLIVFDFDGTLLDSMGMWNNLSGDFVRSYGHEFTREMADKLVPMSLDMSIDYFINELGFDATPEEIFQDFDKKIMDGYGRTLELADGAIEVLKKCQEEGYPMVIATATNRKFVEVAVDRFHLGEFFERIFTADELGHPKTDPMFYEKISQIMDVPYEDLIFVDDSAYNIKTAAELGIETIGIKEGNNRNTWELMDQVADQSVFNLKDWLR